LQRDNGLDSTPNLGRNGTAGMMKARQDMPLRAAAVLIWQEEDYADGFVMMERLR
jgi:hypothetical protein